MVVGLALELGEPVEAGTGLAEGVGLGVVVAVVAGVEVAVGVGAGVAVEPGAAVEVAVGVGLSDVWADTSEAGATVAPMARRERGSWRRKVV